MKIETNNRELITDGVGEASDFGVESGDLPILFEFLRDKMYSDKPLAVVREYACNAADSHIDANCPHKPIEVTLPTVTSPIFSVRDFGIGLSDEGIRKVFAMYGKSTKREDNTKTGALGLGSKSGFAYGDSFNIISRFNGKETCYTALIDPSRVGKVIELNSCETPEPNGVEIQIPVKPKDCSAFYHAAFKALRYFKVRPKLNGVEEEVFWSHESKKEPMLSGDNWRFYGDHKSVAVMGNVGYPLSLDPLRESFSGKPNLLDFIREGVELDFEIGDLDIAISREALEYSEKTKLSILAALEKAYAQVASKFDEKFQNCKSMWEAKSLYDSIVKPGKEYNSLRSIVVNKAQWNGMPIRNNYFQMGNYNGCEVKVYKRKSVRSRRSYGYDNFHVHSEPSTIVEASDRNVIVVNDTGSQIRVKARICSLFPNLQEPDNDKAGRKYDKVYLINHEDGADSAMFEREQYFTDVPTIMLSSIPEPPRVKSAKRSIQKTFVYNPNAHGYRSSDFWLAKDVDVTDGGFYVVIKNYKYLDSRGDQNKLENFGDSHEIKTLVSYLDKIGVKIDANKIVGIKPTAVKKFNKNGWVEFTEYAKKEVEKFIKSYTFPQFFANKEEISKHRYKSEFRVFNSWYQKDLLKGTILESFCKAYNEMNSSFISADERDLHKSVESLSNYYLITLHSPSAKYNLEEMYFDIPKELPLLRFINWETVDASGIESEPVIEYIKTKKLTPTNT